MNLQMLLYLLRRNEFCQSSAPTQESTASRCTAGLAAKPTELSIFSQRHQIRAAIDNDLQSRPFLDPSQHLLVTVVSTYA